jgi:hypothetical protein
VLPALAATGASPMASTPGPDPIFAAIDAFHRADAAVNAVTVDDIPDELGDQCHEAYLAVVRTRPTTPAGLAALTTWVRERTDWPCANSSVLPDEEQRAIAAAVDDATRGMSGLEPWSPPSAAAAPSIPDPVYGVIERHQRLSIAYDKAVNHPDVGDDRPQFATVNEVSSQACTALLDHANMMFTFQPTTPTGVAAMLRYITTLEDWQMPCGMGEPDEIASLKTLCSTMANALDPSGEAEA